MAPKVRSTTTTKAATLVFIHGIFNKPTADILKCQWDHALAGRRLGERSRMAYWVNRARYPEPESGTCDSGDNMPMALRRQMRIGAMAADSFESRFAGPEQVIKQISKRSPDSANFLREMQASIDAHRLQSVGAKGSAQFRNTGLSEFLWDGLSRIATAAFLEDVHDFFFVEAERERMCRSLRERLEVGGGPFVVVAHSQGSMIAYEVLRKMDAAKIDVPLFLTIGSPLGAPPVRARFKKWTKTNKLPFPACVKHWFNVADKLDPVAIDEDLSRDIAKPPAGSSYRNLAERKLNPDHKSNPHSGTGYLRIAEVQRAVREAMEVNFDLPVSKSTISRDLVDQIEASGERHPVLIELRLPDLDARPNGAAETGKNQRNATQLGDAIEKRIRELATQSGVGVKDIGIDRLQRYIAAELNRNEVERLNAEFAGVAIHRFWRDAKKTALINQSARAIHVDAARQSYAARGDRVGWAVLDTGCESAHPHFFANGRNTVARQFDCTQRGPIVEAEVARSNRHTGFDGHGHGTHVAAIIAGGGQASTGGRAAHTMPGIAPDTRIYDFKVLRADGGGRDSYIIKALEKIAEINDQAGTLKIHGVNLSLGGPFAADVYACGHTPLCKELKRLWRQGVVVVIAAGNEGRIALPTLSLEDFEMNQDMSIGDPANLEEAIAVGSVHKANPHSFGISYFSSRGPTADGRSKPDVVAPGERILSAHHRFELRDTKSWYVEMSGTSMAAPHISGLIAAFVSARREFMGEPDKIKQLLMNHCTDLKRERYSQGAGLPNLVQMLAAT